MLQHTAQAHTATGASSRTGRELVSTVKTLLLALIRTGRTVTTRPSLSSSSGGPLGCR